MRFWKILSLLIVVAVASVKLSAQEEPVKPNRESKLLAEREKPGTNNGSELKAKPAVEDPNYLIGPEDELIVNVWRETDLSRTVAVRPDGKISLPLLNDVQAAGLTPMQLGSDITARLKKFIADPQVTIIISRVNSQRIYVVGEVNHAGAYPLMPNMRVLEGISSAGGCTAFAKQTKIYVLRQEGGHEIHISFNFKEVLKGQGLEQNILLKTGDTIVVP